MSKKLTYVYQRGAHGHLIIRKKNNLDHLNYMYMTKQDADIHSYSKIKIIYLIKVRYLALDDVKNTVVI